MADSFHLFITDDMLNKLVEHTNAAIEEFEGMFVIPDKNHLEYGIRNTEYGIRNTDSKTDLTE